MIEWQIVTEGKCARYGEVPKSARIIAVNDREVIGICEACRYPILDGQDYCTGDDCATHVRCRNLEKSTIERRGKRNSCTKTYGISVEAWIGWEDADKHRRSTGGICGGFFKRGMRWTNYLESCAPGEVPYIEAIRADVLKRGLRITGEDHSKDWVPLFSDGTVGQFGTFRAWGDLMAAIWSEAENKDYAYWDFDVKDVGL